MKVLVVFDHPRRHSSCGAVLDELVAGPLTQLVTGVMNYCGIPEVELRLLYDVTDGAGAERRGAQLREVRALGRSLAVQPA